ncbi:hypothetical protein FHS20_000184 [Phyllobacterium endophyticum]|nr:hypothetical protein [Phyllobacterium endophyticum]
MRDTSKTLAIPAASLIEEAPASTHRRRAMP